MSERIRVLYVGGLGRSGSTLLERALSQLPGVVGLGEVVYLWERGIRSNERCGCGEPFDRCPFWTEVGSRAFGGWDHVDLDRIAWLRARVDDVKFVPRLLLPLRPGSTRAALVREYLDHYERLYSAALVVSGGSVVVDSSKVTSLAYCLSHSRRVSLRLVHILRDPRAVAYSWTKVVRRPEVADREAYMPRYSPTYMGLLFSGHHVLLELLRLRRVPSVRLRYEDFADRPVEELVRIAGFAALPVDQATVRGNVPDSLRLGTVHTVSGNPSRFTTGDVVVQRDEKWRGLFPARQRRIVTALTAPLMLRHGYPLLVPRGAEPDPVVDARVRPADPADWPPVTVVLPTHDRPELVRRALRSIETQNYPGRIRTLVVFDRSEPDRDLVSTASSRPVEVMRNARTPGLAGGRNTGILAAEDELVAFLDDDDHWRPEKLARQVAALLAEPGAEFATTAITIDYEDRSIDRLAGRDRVTHAELLRSRMSMLHSSGFLAYKKALVDGIGLVDETLPESMAEDWDLLLRAAERRPVLHVDEPLVRVQWGPTSYFADRWRTRNEARLWMLEHHPLLAQDARAAGLTYGKLAFGHAMLDQRRESWRWARRAMGADWRQPRTVLAALVCLRLLRGQWVVDQLNKRGHGI